MTIKITPDAIENIKALQVEYDTVSDGLRFGLKKEGCSGYKYILEFEKSPGRDDVVLKFEGIDLYINTTHL